MTNLIIKLKFLQNNQGFIDIEKKEYSRDLIISLKRKIKSNFSEKIGKFLKKLQIQIIK